MESPTGSRQQAGRRGGGGVLPALQAERVQSSFYFLVGTHKVETDMHCPKRDVG